MEELQAACEARGVSAIDSSRIELESRLRMFSSWIKSDLSNEQIIVLTILNDAIIREKRIGTKPSAINEE